MPPTSSYPERPEQRKLLYQLRGLANDAFSRADERDYLEACQYVRRLIAAAQDYLTLADAENATCDHRYERITPVSSNCLKCGMYRRDIPEGSSLNSLFAGRFDG